MIAIMSATLGGLFSTLPGRDFSFQPQSCLFRTGDRIDCMHLVVEGSVHLMRPQLNGVELILSRIHAGEIVAEASLYAEQYHCDAVAQGPVRTRAASREDVLRRLREDWNFTDAWMRKLASDIRLCRAKVEILSLKTVAERLDAWLSLNTGTLPDKGGWKIVAAQLGVSPEALYRELARRRTNS